MARNSDYWKSRMQALENTQYEKSLEYYEDLKEQFRQALNGMQMDIELWYRRLAENNDISYAAAKRLLKSKELEEFQWTVEQYIQAGEENAVDQRWMKQLENASARHHISYLEAMKLQTQQYAEVLYTQFEGGITDYLTKNFAEQFYHTAFEISKGVGIGFNLARLDTKAIDTAIRKPWAMDGKNFSDRIWENKDKLVRNLHTELSQCIIRGTDPGKAINSLAKKMNVSKSQAGNLIMTEMAAISAAAQKKCFEELNVEEYEFDATLDGKTCEVCGRMDHKVFRMTDYQVGVTAPPIHPRCRCDTSPYFDDWEEFGIHVQRAARDPETGKTVYVDGSLSYEEWKNQFVYSPIKVTQTSKVTKKEVENEYTVDRQLVNSKKYHDRFEHLTAHKKVDESIYQEALKMLEHRDGTDLEDIVALDARTGEVIVCNNLSLQSGKTGFTEEQYRLYCKHKGDKILLHNHPNSSRLSYADLLTLFNNEEVVCTIAVGHDGSVCIASNPDREVHIDKVYESLYNNYKQEYQNSDISKLHAMDDIYDLGAFKYEKR